jgi:hypothetical protein
MVGKRRACTNSLMRSAWSLTSAGITGRCRVAPGDRVSIARRTCSARSFLIPREFRRSYTLFSAARTNPLALDPSPASLSPVQAMHSRWHSALESISRYRLSYRSGRSNWTILRRASIRRGKASREYPLELSFISDPGEAQVLNYCSLAYSALASFRMGMSGSASFHSVRKSL